MKASNGSSRRERIISITEPPACNIFILSSLLKTQQLPSPHSEDGDGAEVCGGHLLPDFLARHCLKT
ncbi:hypothetical protein MHYP_G00341450 [Metynnis hypsauchen]